MKRDYSKITVLLGLVVLFVLSFNFGFLGHNHYHFGWLREMLPFLMIALFFLLLTRRGRCGRRTRYRRRGRPDVDVTDEPDEDL